MILAICALDIVSDKAPASDNLADHEEDVSLGSDETCVEILSLCDFSPGLCLACVPDELQGGVLCSFDLRARGRGHALADVNLLGNMARNLGIVQDGSCIRGRRMRVVLVEVQRHIGRGCVFSCGNRRVLLSRES